MPHYIMLTIDVEDWFQVENLRSCCPVSSWSSYELRVERNVHRILDLFEEISGQPFGVNNESSGSCKSCQGSVRQDQQDKQEMSSGSNPFSQFRQEPEKKPGRRRKSCLKGFVDNGEGQRTTDFGERLTDNGEQLTTPGQLITDNSEHCTGNASPQAERSSSEAILQPSTSGPVASALNNKSSESCKSCLTSSSPRIRATFFVLGWIAERLPNLVREIARRGHEVASHGYGHELCNKSSTEGLKEDLAKSKKLLEDTIGEAVYGYRAPSFSISDDILKRIEECGYLYDSSYNSFAMHGRYGKISLNGNGRSGIAYKISDCFYELPISNLILKRPFSSRLSALGSYQNKDGFALPWGGGAYFRLIPSWIFRKGVRSIVSEQGAYLFYMHPWEIDPEQPRVDVTPWSSRFRHYVNLTKTEKRLNDMLQRFADCRFVTCHEYLKKVGQTGLTGSTCL